MLQSTLDLSPRETGTLLSGFHLALNFPKHHCGKPVDTAISWVFTRASVLGATRRAMLLYTTKDHYRNPLHPQIALTQILQFTNVATTRQPRAFSIH